MGLLLSIWCFETCTSVQFSKLPGPAPRTLLVHCFRTVPSATFIARQNSPKLANYANVFSMSRNALHNTSPTQKPSRARGASREDRQNAYSPRVPTAEAASSAGVAEAVRRVRGVSRLNCLIL